MLASSNELADNNVFEAIVCNVDIPDVVENVVCKLCSYIWKSFKNHWGYKVCYYTSFEYVVCMQVSVLYIYVNSKLKL